MCPTWEGLDRRNLTLHLHDTMPLLSLEAGFKKNQSCDLSISESSVIGQKTGRRRKGGVVMSRKGPPFPSSHQHSTLCSALLYIHRQWCK